MLKVLTDLLAEEGCPPEQYDRLGLDRPPERRAAGSPERISHRSG
jgi:hypothetical protein